MSTIMGADWTEYGTSLHRLHTERLSRLTTTTVHANMYGPKECDVITIVWKSSLDESDDRCPLQLSPMPKQAGVNKMLTVYGTSGLTGTLATLSLTKRQ